MARKTQKDVVSAIDVATADPAAAAAELDRITGVLADDDDLEPTAAQLEVVIPGDSFRISNTAKMETFADGTYRYPVYITNSEAAAWVKRLNPSERLPRWEASIEGLPAVMLGKSQKEAVALLLAGLAARHEVLAGEAAA